MEISQGLAKRCLRRGERSLFVDPLPQTVENGPRVGLAASAAFLRGVAREPRLALDGEDLGDLLQAYERYLVSSTGSFDQSPTTMAPASCSRLRRD